MVIEAGDELEAIDWDDRMTPEVLAIRVDLYQASRNWDLMAAIANHLAESYPDQVDALGLCAQGDGPDRGGQGRSPSWSRAASRRGDPALQSGVSHPAAEAPRDG